MALFSNLKGTKNSQFTIGSSEAEGFFNGELRIDKITPAALLDIAGDTVISGTIGEFDTYTSAVLHCDGADQSTTFTDATGQHTVTVAGTVEVDTAQSKFGGASAKFGTSGDYIDIAAATDLDFGTGDVTIDFQVRFNGTPGGQTGLFSNKNAWGGGGFHITYAPGTGLFVYWNGVVIYKAWNPSANTWYHVAVVRSGSNVYYFIDGTQIGTTGTNSNDLTNGNSARFGSDVGGTFSALVGHLDEMRISKGIARWTSDFTAPTEAYAGVVTPNTLTIADLTGILKADDGLVGVATIGSNLAYNTGTLSVAASLVIDSIVPAVGLEINGDTAITGVSDPTFDSYTSLVLHFDGSDASTTFTDEIGHTITPAGDAQLDTAYKQFGTASGLFDGTGDSLAGPIDAHFDFGTGNFTVDFWVRFNSLSGQQSLFGGGTGYNNGLGITFVSALGIYIYYNGNGIAHTWSPSLATWYHIAVARSGSDVKIFVDGSQIGSTDTGITDNLSTGQAFHIGGGVTSLDPFNGWLDEFRISKGIARWTAGFTAPTAAYSGTGDAHTLTISDLAGMLKADAGLVGVATIGSNLAYNAGTLSVATSPTFAEIKLTTGAGLNKLLSSDADGDASWVTPGTAMANTVYRVSFTNASLAAGILTVTHNLGTSKYVQVAVYNNSDVLIIPDEVTLSSTTALTVNLLSYGAITGTWNVCVLDAGAATAVTNDFGDALLGILDTNGSHYLRLDAGSNLTADRVLSFVTGDAARTITLSGNPTLDDWFDQSVKTTDGPTFSGPLTIASVAGGDIYLRDTDSRPGADTLLGQVVGFVNDNTTLRQAASIQFYTDAATGASDVPGRIVFNTCPDGSTAITERMRISSAGYVGIGTNAPVAMLEIAAGGNHWASYDWDRGIQLPNSSVMKWKKGTTYAFGIGQTEDSLWFIRNTADDNSATSIYPLILYGSTDQAYFVGNVSALSYTDRTKGPRDAAHAFALLQSMEFKDEELDYKKLHPDLKKISELTDPQTGETVVIPGRDLTMTVSCLVEIIKGLTVRLETLEKR